MDELSEVRSEDLSPKDRAMAEVSGEQPVEVEGEGTLEKEEEKPRIDALVVFGYGIRDDADLEKMDDSGSKNNIEDIKDLPRMRLPMGAKLRTVAAAEIFLQGQVRDVILTGGRVKESAGVDASEASLMKEYMEKILRKRWRAELLKERRDAGAELKAGEVDEQIEAEIDRRWQDADSRILLEDKATNTIENFSHTVNFIDGNRDKYQNIALLSNDFHIDRIKQIADKLLVQGEGISAEPAVTSRRPQYERFVNNYYDVETNNAYRAEVLEAIAPEDERAREAAEARLGTSHEGMLEGEKRWSWGMDNLPAYWLPNIRFIEDPGRLRAILTAEQSVQDVLAEHGIADVNAATHEQLVTALGQVERKLPREEWAEGDSDGK